MTQDVRWQQRLDNYTKALATLTNENLIEHITQVGVVFYQKEELNHD